MTPLERALAHAAKGRAVFPLVPHSKKPLKGSKGCDDATTDASQIRAWWKKTPDANIGIATGLSRLLVLDEDPRHGGRESLKALIEELELPATRVARTPGKGRHLYFRLPEGQALGCGQGVRPGIDVRADGGYVVAPGSVNGAGKWRWEDPKVPIVVAPKALLDFLAKPARKAVVSTAQSRHAELVRQTWRDRANGLAEEDVLRRALESTNGQELVNEGREDEIRRMVKGAFEKEPDHFLLNDLGNARRFVYEYGELIRYSWTSHTWLFWDGRHWQRDSDGGIDRFAKDTVLGWYAEAASCENDDQRKRLAAHAARSAKAERIAGMVRLARSEIQVAVRDEVFDRDPWALNFANGTVDLRTSTLRPHRRDDFITHCLPFNYDPKAKSELWEKTFERVFRVSHDERENEALRRYVKRMLGYCATGSTREECVAVFYGGGRNGKGTIVETVRHSLPPGLAQVMGFETLLHDPRKNSQHLEIDRLRGVRLVTASEADEGRRFSEAMLKQLTGGDELTGRGHYEKFRDFTPTHKIVISVNHLPEIRGTDEGIWERIRLVPFTATIPKKERDTTLKERLRKESAAVATWLVEGAREWFKNGLGRATLVDAATTEYRQDSDVFADFFSRCIFDPDHSITSGKLFKAYEGWRKANGAPQLSPKTLANRLQDAAKKTGATITKGKVQGQRGWIGLSWKNAFGVQFGGAK